MTTLPKSILIFLLCLIYTLIECSLVVTRTPGQDVILNCTVESQDIFLTLSRENNSEIIWKFKVSRHVVSKEDITEIVNSKKCEILSMNIQYLELFYRSLR